MYEFEYDRTSALYVSRAPTTVDVYDTASIFTPSDAIVYTPSSTTKHRTVTPDTDADDESALAARMSKPDDVTLWRRMT